MSSNRNRDSRTPLHPVPDGQHTRRAFLGTASVLGAVALTGVGWSPANAVPAGSPAATLPVPPDFPADIPLAQQAFQNWSEQITIEDVWTATPADAQDVVAIANWANAAGYRVRARGMGHTWSPILLPADSSDATLADVILVDTTVHLTGTTITPGSPATVTVGAGTTIDTLLATLEAAGHGLLESTAPGDLTIGGVLAVGGHGTGIPALGETRPTGASYGSLANLVLSLTAVVWDEPSGSYQLRTFDRTDPDIGALLVHLGRAFVTEVTLQVIDNQRLRCLNIVDIPVADLFGAPGSANALADYLDETGRVEAIWFPFTDYPWLKVWSVSPTQPSSSRYLDAPYPYTFANIISQPESDLIKAVVAGEVAPTPIFEVAEMAIVDAGLLLTDTTDVWGWSRTSQLYVQPTTLRIVEAGWAVLTARANAQQVLHEFYDQYQALLTSYQNDGEFPVNGPVEIRVTALDQPAEVAVPGAVIPQLAATRPRPDHPEWDTCVWLDIGTLPGTPASARFYTDIETWICANYIGELATVRPEWSKAWAHTPDGAGPTPRSSPAPSRTPSAPASPPRQRRRRLRNPQPTRPGPDLQQPVPGRPTVLTNALPTPFQRPFQTRRSFRVSRRSSAPVPIPTGCRRRCRPGR